MWNRAKGVVLIKRDLINCDVKIIARALLILVGTIYFCSCVYEIKGDTTTINSVASIFSAIGTVGALLASLWIFYTDSNRRAVEKERVQAELVSGWLGDKKTVTLPQSDYPTYNATLLNHSNQPIYTVIAKVVMFRGDNTELMGREKEFCSTFLVVPPGKYDFEISHPGHGMNKKFAVEIVFKDVHGKTWVRKATGNLLKVLESPAEYYKISEPVGWGSI